MYDFIDQLIVVTRTELTYIEGFLVMQRERYAEYERDLRLALAVDDMRRVGQIDEALEAFREEIAYLEAKRASAAERLATLEADTRFPAMGVRLRETDRRDTPHRN